ncbi:PepSY-associated TM helix domain-containing protein [Hymenobacter cellulosivorans]|uniref:PepSY domain-containing protein n=1 Tax=Hymenobacter cellulosivorans TaxID=2932249 RepID=A0ABY4F636_9BACT|nr:PepSY-associated TM helix domain-containing protein [Hymenobacter cellulosivorans]UOQ52134.1 PepSY domain-containing protein [Hymenobacter cellulosivorans]
MSRATLTRRLFALHSWLGLLTGGLLLVVSLSGVVLLFEPELDHALNPRLLQVTAPPGARSSLDRVLAEARRHFPHPAYLRLRRIPTVPTDAVEVSVDQPDHTWTLAYFDPYTGQYLGQRYAREHLFGWLLGVHYSLLAGKGGELTVALLGMALLLSVLTGAVVYRKHLLPVLLLRPKLSWKNWRAASSGLHRVVGVWALLFNLLMGASGLWMLRYTFLPATYAAAPEKPSVAQPLVAVSLDTLARRAARAVPGFKLQGLALPRTAADTVVKALGRLADRPLYGNFSQTVELSARTGQVLKAADVRQAGVGEQAELVALTLHFGQFGGVLSKLLWTVGGLSPALLSLTGFVLWQRRRRTPQRRLTRA